MQPNKEGTAEGRTGGAGGCGRPWLASSMVITTTMRSLPSAPLSVMRLLVMNVSASRSSTPCVVSPVFLTVTDDWPCCARVLVAWLNERERKRGAGNPRRRKGNLGALEGEPLLRFFQLALPGIEGAPLLLEDPPRLRPPPRGHRRRLLVQAALLLGL